MFCINLSKYCTNAKIWGQKKEVGKMLKEKTSTKGVKFDLASILLISILLILFREWLYPIRGHVIPRLTKNSNSKAR